MLSLRVLGAVSTRAGPSAATKMDSLGRVFTWLKQPEDTPLDQDSSWELLAAVNDVSEDLLAALDGVIDDTAEVASAEEVRAFVLQRWS